MPFSYDAPLFRPPSEADSLILQVTLGCSHNQCTFCGMYRSKRFTTKSLDKIRAEVAEAQAVVGKQVRRVFLADGDAMCLSTSRLADILDSVRAAFPRLERVGAYANARDILAKSDDDLALLKSGGLGILYLGLESGDEVTLAEVAKGATAVEIVAAVSRARAAGLQASVMVLIGLAGRERSLIHARASAEAVNSMSPEYTGLLTYTPVPGTPLMERISRGDFELPSPEESLAEIREFVSALDCATYFTCNHASNYLPLKGKMPEAKRDLLVMLDAALAGLLPLRPQSLRGL